MSGSEPPRHQAKVVTVSDGVVAGTREDASGAALEDLLTKSGFEVVGRSTIPDGVASVAGELVKVCASFSGLVVTTGGTGFAPRDQTPEGTREIIERDAVSLLLVRCFFMEDYGPRLVDPATLPDELAELLAAVAHRVAHLARGRQSRQAAPEWSGRRAYSTA